MKNHAKVIELLEQFYIETNDKKKTILLGSSAYLMFTRKQLYTELINRTSAFKGVKTFNYTFANLVKKGFISVNKKARRKPDGSKTYFISESGISKLPSGYHTFIQVLVDDSSEEVEEPGGVLIPGYSNGISTEVPTEDQLHSNDGIAVGICGGPLTPDRPREPTDQEKIIFMCDRLEQTLLAKNESYGNSSLKPIGIFDLPRSAKVQSRLEDKISRLAQLSRGTGKEALKDTLLDLAGYSILYLIILEEE